MDKYLAIREKIDEAIEKNLKEIAELSDYIADHPEVSGEEYETSKKLVETLRAKGFETEYPFAGLETSFRAIYGPNDHKYKVAVLTEYDALPGIGHACGHNLSGAISLLAGIAASGIQDELDCDIHVVGTPAEETDGAKCGMCNQGIFKNYDMAIMVHLYDQNLVYCRLNGLSCIQYDFYGKASHAGASPWEGRNALNAAMLMIHGLDCIRGCCTPDSRLNSIILKGGYAAGSIPEDAKVETWTRSPNYEYMLKLNERAENCAKGAALMAECEYESKFVAEIYKTMRRNYTGEAAIEDVFNELGLEINGDHKKLFGSSDIGNVSFECPAFHPTLQLAERGTAIHTREFMACVKGEKAHKCLADGAKLISHTIAKIFSDEEKIKKMKEDFEANQQ